MANKIIIGLFIVFISYTASAETESKKVTSICIEQAADRLSVPLSLVWGILAVEKGQVGSISKNKNGTYDIGPMQINSSWLTTFAELNISEEMLLNDPCINIYAGAWILARCLRQNNNFYGVGTYHSKTEEYQLAYLKRLGQAMSRLQVNDLLKQINGEYDGKLSKK